MLELVRYQKESMPKAVGCEDVVYSCNSILSEERRQRNELGILADMKLYSIPYQQIKKIANFRSHIWGL